MDNQNLGVPSAGVSDTSSEVLAPPVLTADGLSDLKKARQKALIAKWRLEHPDQVKEHARRWRVENRDKIKARRRTYKRNRTESSRERWKSWEAANSKKHPEVFAQENRRRRAKKNEASIRWRQRNPEKVQAQGRAWRESTRFDPLVKLKFKLRRRLRQVLRGKVKSARAVADLGCSMLEFKVWIEQQFEPWMTWDNQGNGDGKWNLDHIIPFMFVNLDEPEIQKKLVHYTNLRPLGSEANQRRNNRAVLEEELRGLGLLDAAGQVTFPCDRQVDAGAGRV